MSFCLYGVANYLLFAELFCDIKNFGDNEIYWIVNEQRFMQDFRDKALIDAIGHRIDSVSELKKSHFNKTILYYIIKLVFKIECGYDTQSNLKTKRFENFTRQTTSSYDSIKNSYIN